MSLCSPVFGEVIWMCGAMSELSLPLLHLSILSRSCALEEADLAFIFPLSFVQCGTHRAENKWERAGSSSLALPVISLHPEA